MLWIHTLALAAAILLTIVGWNSLSKKGGEGYFGWVAYVCGVLTGAIQFFTIINELLKGVLL